jgi:hypothetical protein
MTLELNSSLGSRMSRPKRETNVPNTTSRVLSALWSLTTDKVWQLLPGNITKPVRVAAGSPPAYRARPTWDMPVQHANNAAAAVVSIYRAEAVAGRLVKRKKRASRATIRAALTWRS